MTSWLRTEGGVRKAIGAGGLVIGRSSACAIVVDDPEVSRRHALVLAGGLVISLGGGEQTTVAHGGSFRIGSATFVYEHEHEPSPARWAIKVGGASYPIHAPTVTIGSTGADLVVDGLPPNACTVHAAEHVVVVDILDGDSIPLPNGGAFALHGVELEIQAIGDGVTTVVEQLPSSVILELVPKGVVLRLRVGTVDHTAFLPQARGDLVLALLRPAPPAKPGDLIDDEVVLQALHGRAGGTRQQLNVTIHRARMSLTAAGLVGPLLIQRAPGGGATRFRLASNATISQI